MGIGPLVPEKNIFEGFLLYMGVAAILVRPGSFEQIFVPPNPLRLRMKFGFDWPSGFWGEVVWRLWTTDGRTTEPAYTISSPKSIKAQVS